LAETFARDAAVGTFALGKLAAGLKAQQKTKTETHDPDTPVGAGASAGLSQWHRKIDKMRADVAKGTKSFADLQALKKEARASGIDI
jgi:hypothetical protein